MFSFCVIRTIKFLCLSSLLQNCAVVCIIIVVAIFSVLKLVVFVFRLCVFVMTLVIVVFVLLL